MKKIILFIFALLLTACAHQEVPIVKKERTVNDEQKFRSLSMMLMRDKIEDFKIALESKTQDVQGMSGENVMHSIVFYNKKELISYVASKGFSPEIQDDFGITPLMLAIQLKRIDLIKELLKYTKNIDLRDFMGNTALIKAVESNNHEIVFLLLRHHANKMIMNDLGQKPIDVVKDNDIADLLK